MEFNDEFCLDYINLLNNHTSKTNSKKIINSIINYTLEYAEINQTPFLIEEIFKTKFDELFELFSKNNYIKTLIKNKKIKPENICNIQPEILDPETYNHIIKKKELIELKKQNNGTTDAYTCKKCKNNKCNVTERQTRAGDEPATVFITCIECGYTFSI
jgi:DNA-directed RNA polymerase subunit M/transcription elongation factor TFIIS